MPGRPDLPREGPDGRLTPPRPGSNGDLDDRRVHDGPPDPGGRSRAAVAVPIAAALIAAGALVDLGSATNDLASVAGHLDPDSRTVAIASYTGVLLVTAAQSGVAIASVAARRSRRWWVAGWGALLALALYRGLAAAPLLFGEISVQVRPAPVWRLAVDAVTGVAAAVVCLAAPPIGEPR
ncbi:MAG TPA: hypothetical protein VFO60_03710 [Candidatus Dormibacteraeota bacterium]|nr:hypothetical protein [Candidatus Dormibacteraeota bacterium]